MFNTLSMIGPETAAIVFIAVLLLFGGKKIPELMRGVGQGVGELKKGMEETSRQISDSVRHEEPVVKKDQEEVPAAPAVPASTTTPTQHS